MKTTLLSVAMLLASTVAAYGFDVDPTVAVNQACVTVAAGTAEVYKSRDACKQPLVKGYFNICKGQTIPGQETPLPEDGLIADQVCPPPTDPMSYWFLGRPAVEGLHQADDGVWHQNADSASPEALGPYPSQEMCFAAEHAVAPNDRTFWLPAEYKLWKAYDSAKWNHDAEEAAYTDLMRRYLETNPKPGRYYVVGSNPREHFVVQGRETGWSSSSGEIFSDTDGVAAYGSEIEKRMTKTIVPDAPEKLGADTYTVIQPCAPVRGWTK